MSFTLREMAGRLTRIWSQHQSLKFLIVVPLLVAVCLVSFRAGRSANVLPQEYDEKAALVRQRRDVTYPPKAPEQNQGGATYTRWGRTSCPDGDEEVYNGFTGGAWFANHGGGSNYLCLPPDPQWGNHNEAVEKPGKLYGAEYESPSGFDFSNNGGRTTHDHNVPCVVCRSLRRSSVLMIPARNRCYDGWSLAYTGYLMSANPGHAGRTQFVCMDGSPEADPAGFRDENGALFYNVEGVCGSLPCPPYVQRREITCAVCTK